MFSKLSFHWYVISINALILYNNKKKSYNLKVLMNFPRKSVTPSHSRPPINTHRFETGDPSYIEGLLEHNVMCIINCVILCFNFSTQTTASLGPQVI